MTDDLLARIDALTACPSCRGPVEQEAFVLYEGGRCYACAFKEAGEVANEQIAATRHGPDYREASRRHMAAMAVAAAGDHARQATQAALNLGVSAREAIEAFGHAAEAVAEVVRRPINPEFVAALGGCICDREPDTNASIPNEDCSQHGTAGVWTNQSPSAIAADMIRDAGFQIYGPDATSGQIEADDAAWRWRVRNRFAMLTQRPARPLTPAAVAQACGVPLDLVDPSATPPKPLSTWQTITRWCQRRLARRRHHR